MGEWFDNEKERSSKFIKLLKERVDIANPSRMLTTEETKRLNKLESIANKL